MTLKCSAVLSSNISITTRTVSLFTRGLVSLLDNQSSLPQTISTDFRSTNNWYKTKTVRQSSRAIYRIKMLLLTLTTLATTSTTTQQISSFTEGLRGKMELWETQSLGRENLIEMFWMLKKLEPRVKSSGLRWSMVWLQQPAQCSMPGTTQTRASPRGSRRAPRPTVRVFYKTSLLVSLISLAKIQSQLSLTMQEMYDLGRHIANIKLAIKSKQAPLKVAQTRQGD